MKKSVAAILTLGLLSGCASVFDGTTQDIVVNTNPPGASCVLEREGAAIGSIPSTPASITIQKTKHDITIRCNKPGYQEATFMNKSGNSAATLGNLVLSGGVGWAVDSARGADNKYDSPVNITLNPAK